MKNTIPYLFFFLMYGSQVWGQTSSVSSGQWQLPAVQEPVFKKDTFSVVTYGAIPDGRTLNTASIQKAIQACHAHGGGVVLIPEGLWLSGPLELKSHVNLHLQRGATLLFTTDKSQYALIESNWEGLPAVRNQSPISGTDLENIAITGKGIIDGNGEVWRAVKKNKLTASQWKKLVASGGVVSEDGKLWYPSEQFARAAKTEQPGVLTNGKTLQDFVAYKDFFRPNLLVLTRCKKVLLQGPTFQNSAAWGLHPLMCEEVTVRDVMVKNVWYAQNGDGIDVESCSNVLIEHSLFDVGDDGICIKSGRDEEGRKRGMPSKNIHVRHCTVYQAHGGFVIGSEMSGGVQNMYVEHCTFIGTDIGLRFKTSRGRGGIVENVFIRDIYMKNIVEEAILFDMYYMGKAPVMHDGEEKEEPVTELFPVDETTPRFRNFFIENIVCNGAEKAIFVRGLPEMNIKDIYFKNLNIQAKKGVDIIEGKNISLKDVHVWTQAKDPVVSVQNANFVRIDGLRYNKEADWLLGVAGKKTEGIKIVNTEISKKNPRILFSNGAREKSVQIK